MTARILNVELGSRSYPIRIGSNLLRDPVSYQLLRGRRAMLVTDENVAHHHLDGVLEALKLPRDQALILKAGESQKSWNQAGEVLDWMLAQGVGATLAAYGGQVAQGAACAREGALALTKWTSALRAAMQAHPGHYLLMSALRRAAYTDDGGLLFVHAGLDPDRPLSAQSDSLWWGTGGFARLDRPYGNFAKVVRGFDRAHPGLESAAFTLTVDGGCGFGGPLLAVCLDAKGDVVDLIEA